MTEQEKIERRTKALSRNFPSLRKFGFLIRRKTSARRSQQVLNGGTKYKNTSLYSNLNPGIGAAWAGQRKVIVFPWAICNEFILSAVANLGAELPIGAK